VGADKRSQPSALGRDEGEPRSLQRAGGEAGAAGSARLQEDGLGGQGSFSTCSSWCCGVQGV